MELTKFLPSTQSALVYHKPRHRQFHTASEGGGNGGPLVFRVAECCHHTHNQKQQLSGVLRVGFLNSHLVLLIFLISCHNYKDVKKQLPNLPHEEQMDKTDGLLQGCPHLSFIEEYIRYLPMALIYCYICLFHIMEADHLVFLTILEKGMITFKRLTIWQKKILTHDQNEVSLEELLCSRLQFFNFLTPGRKSPQSWSSWSLQGAILGPIILKMD